MTGRPKQNGLGEPTSPETASSKNEKNNVDSTSSIQDAQAEEVKVWRGLVNRLVTFGRVEVGGITPIPIEERVVTKTVNVFTLWWCMNANMLPRYLVAVPVLLNLATLVGFCVIMVVIGGQCLSAVGGGNVSPAVGIVIVALLALVISFCGFTILHLYERFAWIPAVIAIVIATGCGGSHLRDQAPTEPATAQAVVSFGMIVASYMLPWACLASDFTTYLEPSTSSLVTLRVTLEASGSFILTQFVRKRIFWYTYAGLATPTILLMILGAAIAGAVTSVPSWETGYEDNLVGGVMAAMLSPAGGFGEFVTVILSFTLLGNIAATSYSVTLNFQLLLALFSRKATGIPRYVYALLVTAVVIPVGIRAATDFFASLENFIALIGYWSAAFLGVVLAEHLWFRGADCTRYDPDTWDDAARLPLGVAALAACVSCFGVVVPCMAQVWWIGPIAETTGDIGFELAFVAETDGWKHVRRSNRSMRVDARIAALLMYRLAHGIPQD
ncbi:purine-cytosine permease FCY21 [Colletotrichum salicis]|uniref:Purine-cytosine permease FCY21 n=1 Tax=Colletotrichum salicis TaxID=1209931 RepID=A0A135V4N0_9PEZI|nr:purine-cytosine permease FCY21 [Colletotrichum salicis]